MLTVIPKACTKKKKFLKNSKYNKWEFELGIQKYLCNTKKV